MSTRVLVTGATGFLGSELVRQLLDQGRTVRVLCRSNPDPALFDVNRVEVAIGDVTSRETLPPALRDVSQLYHVAGRVDFNPRNLRELLAVNVDGTRNVLSAAEKAGVGRIVHVSSVSTIGGVASPDQTFNEDDLGKGTGTDIPYPQSKLRGEKVALEFADRGVPVMIVNPTFFAGPGDWNLSSARTMLAFVHGQVWVGLTRGGLGFTDVRDVAAGMIAAMERGQPGRRYILGGHNLLVREYHDLLAQASGRRPPRVRVHPNLASALAVVGVAAYWAIRRKRYVGLGDIRMGRNYWLYDYTRARTELGLVCRPPIDTIRDTLDWLAARGLW